VESNRPNTCYIHVILFPWRRQKRRTHNLNFRETSWRQVFPSFKNSFNVWRPRLLYIVSDNKLLNCCAFFWYTIRHYMNCHHFHLLEIFINVKLFLVSTSKYIFLGKLQLILFSPTWYNPFSFAWNLLLLGIMQDFSQ
jgi:hypothetical protein